MGRSIPVGQVGVVDGERVSPDRRVASAVAPLFHHRHDDVLGLADCTLGRVDEAELRPAPLRGVRLAIGAPQARVLDVPVVGQPPLERFLCSFPALSRDGERVLGTETTLQLFLVAPPAARTASDPCTRGEKSEQHDGGDDAGDDPHPEVHGGAPVREGAQPGGATMVSLPSTCADSVVGALR